MGGHGEEERVSPWRVEKAVAWVEKRGKVSEEGERSERGRGMKRRPARGGGGKGRGSREKREEGKGTFGPEKRKQGEKMRVTGSTWSLKGWVC